MADNINVTQGTGTIVATDDVAGVHFQKVKIDLGGNGASVPLGVGQQANAASMPVTLATEQQALLAKPSAGTPASVPSSDTAVVVLASNASRKGATFYYDGAATLYLVFSNTDPTSSLFSVKMGADFYTYVEAPAGYTGAVKGIWSSEVGAVLVTELV